MKNLKFLFAFLVLNALFFTSCDKDDEPENEVELITTVKLTFTESGGGSTTFKVTDLDGDGGNAPVAEQIKLKPSTTYTVGVQFLDERDASNVENITEEVMTENKVHLVCFSATGSMVAPTRTDQDDNGKPLGLASTVTTGSAGTGTLQVMLRHEPDKGASDPCSTGETDADVTFPAQIQ